MINCKNEIFITQYIFVVILIYILPEDGSFGLEYVVIKPTMFFSFDK
jgi:hypothetical protein